jgi:hypothetical protein
MPVDADLVASTALACPSVASLTGGAMGEVATYLPGRRVVGVRISDHEVEVHVRARWGAVLPDVGKEVRSALSRLAEGRSVSVYIDDVEAPSDDG